MYKLLLAHRRPRGRDRDEFQRALRSERTGLIGELWSDLGCTDYVQLHQAGRFDPVYQGIRATRSWPFTAPAALVQGYDVRPWWTDGGSVAPGAPWDVVETLAYESRGRLLEHLQSPGGERALERLAEDQSVRCRSTDAFLVDSAVPVSGSTDGSDAGTEEASTSVVFFLRRRAGSTRRAMQTYWRDDHGERVVSLRDALGYRLYEQMFVRDGDAHAPVRERLGPGPRTPYDGIARLTYADGWALGRGFFDPRTLIANTRLVADEITFADAQRSTMVVGREYRLDSNGPLVP